MPDLSDDDDDLDPMEKAKLRATVQLYKIRQANKRESEISDYS